MTAHAIHIVAFDNIGLMGRMLILAGLVLVAAGVLIMLSEKLPIRLGRLPGDIHWVGKSGGFYFPIVTCLLISGILTIAFWIAGRFR